LKLVNGVYLPDGEDHLVSFLEKKETMVDGKGSYQYHKFSAAMQYVKNWRFAVDVGGHCGLWSMHMAKRFQTVFAFEPIKAHRDCFEKNVPDKNVLLFDFALGEKEGIADIFTNHTSSGDSWVVPAGSKDLNGKIEKNVLIKKLDDFCVQELDFLKIDCEGYELFVLQGAEETLRKSKPCVIVEQKPGRADKFGLQTTQAVDYLRSLGAVLVKEMSGDYIMNWPTR
jgi:FkbM family methyltransferase